MARLHTLFAERLVPGTPITDRLFNWPGDMGAGGGVVPVRLAGARAATDAPLARMAMEGDGRLDSAALTLTVWDGGPGSGVAMPMGRVDFHGRFIRWDPATGP
jgi:hypothetical protein